MCLTDQTISSSTQSGHTMSKKLFLDFFFAYPHQIVFIGQIKLNKVFGLTQLIQTLSYQEQRILVLNNKIVEAIIIDIQLETII